MAVAAVRRGDEWLFIQRPPTGLWAGLWELPTETVQDGESPAAAFRRLAARLPKGIRFPRQPSGTVVRQLTHRQITFHVYVARSVTAPAQKPAQSGPRWLTPDGAAVLGISRACQAILRFLDVNSNGSSV